MSIRAPSQWLVEKTMLRQSCNWQKHSKIIESAIYGTYVDHYATVVGISCRIEPVKEQDILLQPGEYKTGDMFGYFLDAYHTHCIKDFNTVSEYVYDHTKILVTGGKAKLKSGFDVCMPYPIDNPTIYPADGCPFGLPITSITTIQVTPCKIEGSTVVATEIKYILSGDNGTVWYYWNGSVWAISDGTYTKSNTITEIDAHLSTFPITSGIFKFKAFLHSDDGTQTPELDNFEATFESEVEIDDLIIFGDYTYKIIEIEDWTEDLDLPHKEALLRRFVGE